MNAKLKAAIEKLTEDDLYDIGPSIQDEIDIVLAAARAYACEECGGSGVVRCAVSDTRGDCLKCLADREVADAE